MKYAIVYSSRTGNTKKLADKALEVLEERSQGECLYFGEASGTDEAQGGAEECISDADVLYAGFWTDKGNADGGMLRFLKALGEKEKIPGQIILFGTAGFGADQAYYDRIIKTVAGELPEPAKLKASFMCQGRMQQNVLERYQSMLEANPEDSRTQLMVENYKAALTHPDEADLAAFKEFLIKR